MVVPSKAEIEAQFAEQLNQIQFLAESNSGFKLILAKYYSPKVRDTIIEALSRLTGLAQLRVMLENEERAYLTQRFKLFSRERDKVIHLIDTFPNIPDEVLTNLNYSRESIADYSQCVLVFWLIGNNLDKLARLAPDFWSWRATVTEFITTREPLPVNSSFAQKNFEIVSSMDLEEKKQRTAELRGIIETSTPDYSHIRIWLELSEIYYFSSDFDQSLGAANETKKLALEFEEPWLLAEAWDMIANNLSFKGELDEALAIRREEVLPALGKLGDVRSVAVTKGKIADIMETRGMLDEALAIRREEVLPVFEKLGDVRSVAVTKGQIADIMETRGMLDEALAIRREEVLPVFEKLGDVRSVAVTKGQIADIMTARGMLDEALAIRREEVLPVYEKLGDVRSVAVTKGKIADIMETRGMFDEALAIRQDVELPVYEKLGDLRSIAVTKAQIADIMSERGFYKEALNIRLHEVMPTYEKIGDKRSLEISKDKVERLKKRIRENGGDEEIKPSSTM